MADVFEKALVSRLLKKLFSINTTIKIPFVTTISLLQHFAHSAFLLLLHSNRCTNSSDNEYETIEGACPKVQRTNSTKFKDHS